MAEPPMTAGGPIPRYWCCYCELPLRFRHGATAPPYWEHVETREPRCATSQAMLALPRSPLLRVKRLVGPTGNGPSGSPTPPPTSDARP